MTSTPQSATSVQAENDFGLLKKIYNAVQGVPKACRNLRKKLGEYAYDLAIPIVLTNHFAQGNYTLTEIERFAPSWIILIEMEALSLLDFPWYPRGGFRASNFMKDAALLTLEEREVYLGQLETLERTLTGDGFLANPKNTWQKKELDPGLSEKEITERQEAVLTQLTKAEQVAHRHFSERFKLYKERNPSYDANGYIKTEVKDSLHGLVILQAEHLFNANEKSLEELLRDHVAYIHELYLHYRDLNIASHLPS